MGRIGADIARTRGGRFSATDSEFWRPLVWYWARRCCASDELRPLEEEVDDAEDEVEDDDELLDDDCLECLEMVSPSGCWKCEKKS